MDPGQDMVALAVVASGVLVVDASTPLQVLWLVVGPVLGVGVAREQTGAVTAPTGATLGPVTPGGPAASAGLRPGDVVTKLDGRRIDDESLVAPPSAPRTRARR